MLFSEAAFIIRLVEHKKGSIKTLVHRSKCQEKQSLLAIVCETIKAKAVLEEILKLSQVLVYDKTLKRDPNLALVLVYDFLFGKQLRQAPKKLRENVLKNKSSLRSALARVKIKHRVATNNELLLKDKEKSVVIPRYVRVNTLKTTTEDVISHFKDNGFVFKSTGNIDYKDFKDKVQALKRSEFLKDLHVDNLLVFHPKTEFHDNSLYLKGHIILQDKASCLPAFVLNPTPGFHVVDACAAPGNKTSHAAAIMNNTGKIHSFDLDKKRLLTMKLLLSKAGVTSCHPVHGDFLKVNTKVEEYSDVKCVITDPSCSGSGIVNRLGHVTDDDQSASKERLEALSNFQYQVVLHAMSFPSVEHVVYSTCSIHQQENEDVVQRVIAKRPDFQLQPVLPELPSRGVHRTFEDAKLCLRLGPESDLTNGFFVALFQRVSSSQVSDNAKGKMKRKLESTHVSQQSCSDIPKSTKDGNCEKITCFSHSQNQTKSNQNSSKESPNSASVCKKKRKNKNKRQKNS